MNRDIPDTPAPVVFVYPSQIETFEKAGMVRGKDYFVYKCLKCLDDMDRCKCNKVK